MRHARNANRTFDRDAASTYLSVRPSRDPELAAAFLQSGDTDSELPSCTFDGLT